MELNVTAAKARLSALISAAERGEDVIITKRGVAAVRLVPVILSRPVRLGLLQGLVTVESIPEFCSSHE